MSVLDALPRFLDNLALVVSVFGIFVVLVAGAQALVEYVRQQILEWAGGDMAGYAEIRIRFGLKILLGLEFLIAADLVRSIVTPSFFQLGALAAVVAIRIALSYFLGWELRNLASAATPPK